jgi:hypothetical protein
MITQFYFFSLLSSFFPCYPMETKSLSRKKKLELARVVTNELDNHGKRRMISKTPKKRRVTILEIEQLSVRDSAHDSYSQISQLSKKKSRETLADVLDLFFDCTDLLHIVLGYMEPLRIRNTCSLDRLYPKRHIWYDCECVSHQNNRECTGGGYGKKECRYLNLLGPLQLRLEKRKRKYLNF